MAIAIDASSPAALAIGASTASGTTAAFTTPTGVLLVAQIIADINTTGAYTTHTISGAGLTWSLAVQSSPQADGDMYAALWVSTYSAGALTSVTVTDTLTNSSVESYTTVKVSVLTGTATSAPFVGVTGNTTALAASASLTVTPQAVGSLLLANSVDFNVIGPTAGSYTPAAGQTALAQAFISAHIGGAIWQQTALTASLANATLSLSGPSGQSVDMVAAEILAAGAGPAPPIVPARHVNRSVGAAARRARAYYGPGRGL